MLSLEVGSLSSSQGWASLLCSVRTSGQQAFLAHLPVSEFSCPSGPSGIHRDFWAFVLTVPCGAAKLCP